MNGARHWRWPLLLLSLTLTAVGLAALASGPLGQGPALALAIAALAVYGPLALFLPACWRVDKRVLAWFSFLLLFYFCGFVLQAVNPPPTGYWGVASAVLVSALFVVTVLALRSRSPLHD